MIKKKWPATKVANKYDIGFHQLLAFMSRYEVERLAEKDHKHD